MVRPATRVLSLAAALLSAAYPTQPPQNLTPASFVIVLDTSGSMRDKLAMAREAATLLLLATVTHDEFAIVGTDDKPELLSPFGATRPEAFRALGATVSKGKAYYVDGVHFALGHLRTARHNNKALVLITDGQDGWGRHHAPEVAALARKLGIRVYPLVMLGGFPHLSREEEFPLQAPLIHLARNSGGRYFSVLFKQRFDNAVNQILAELRAPR